MLGVAVDKACLEDSDCTLEGAEVREPRITATTSSCLGQETRGHEYAVSMQSDYSGGLESACMNSSRRFAISYWSL